VTTLSIDEFENLSGFIYRKTGIRFESKKIYYISKRIEKRMEALSVETVNEYIRMLRFSDSGGNEFQNLVDLLTINETYFFRDFPQLQAFGEHCLADVAQRKAARGDQRLRVWSAPCSTGEEPYTLGIILDAMLDNIRLWEIEIIASDIDRRVLDTARSGKYEQRRLRDVPPEYMQDYFLASANGTREISKKIRGLVKFEHLNLCDKESLRSRMGFDFIFCRNLLIYFDEVSRKQLVDQFYLALNPGGYIFLGSSESVGRISTAFKMKRVGGYLVYYKP
jgi:chemotaxis protein methyltransferase CheR